MSHPIVPPTRAQRSPVRTPSRLRRRLLILSLLPALLVLLAGCNKKKDEVPAPNPVPTDIGKDLAARGLPTPLPGGRVLAKLPVFPELDTPLEVVQTQPGDGTDGAAFAKHRARIVVRFNHPVVALVSAEEQAKLPAALTVAPAVAAKGEWLNTSTYVLTPEEDLEPASDYVVTVDGTLTDVLGGKLGAAKTVTFKTAAPAVVETVPESGSLYASPTGAISVTFNGAMDPASVGQAFTLLRAEGGDGAPSVGGSTRWVSDTLEFKPSAPLELGAKYALTIGKGAMAANGKAGLTEDYRVEFTTAPKPVVVKTDPPDEAQKSRHLMTYPMEITFNTPMVAEQISVTVQPTIANQTLYTYDDAGMTVQVGGKWLASMAYTVTVKGESRSREGQALGEDKVIHFSTSSLMPSVGFETTGNRVGVYSSYRPSIVYLRAINTASANVQLHAVPLSDFVGLMTDEYRYQKWDDYLPAPDSTPLNMWKVQTAAPTDAIKYVTLTLGAEGGRLAPGLYLARLPGFDKQLFLSTSMNLALKFTDSEVLVWATDLQTGQPVANQPITVYESAQHPLATGKTNADGVFRANFPQRAEPWEPLVALSEVDGRVVAALSSEWNTGLNGYEFNLPTTASREKYYANLFTDRPIYRAGQTVYFRGVLRQDDDAIYQMPVEKAVHIQVRDNDGKPILTEDLPLSAYGTFAGEVQLSPAAPLGGYVVEMYLGPEGEHVFGDSQSFLVAAYRKPEFEVAVTTDRPEYSQGDTMDVVSTASYFFGGPVADAKVKWRVIKDDYFFSPDRSDGYWDFSDYDVTENRVYAPQAEVTTEGEGLTDAAGKFTVKLPADVSDHPLSQVFTIESEVTDLNNQAVANRTSATVHKSQLYMGLRPQEYVGQAGTPQGVEVITLDTAGVTVTGQTVNLSYLLRNWYSVKEKHEDGKFYWTSKFTDTLEAKETVDSGAKGYAVGHFTPKQSGVYRIVAEAKDKAGNPSKSATYAWISGEKFVNWRQENNDRIALVAAKKSYVPGETAEVLIPAPFAGAEALLTLERGKIRDVRRLTLKGNSETIRIPVTGDMAPNIYVSVILVKGVGPNSPTPQFKLGYTNLNVAAVEKQLDIQVTPDRSPPAHYGPRDKVKYALQVRDHAGRPVQAELSLALVDKALLSLASDASTALDQAFYGQRMLAVANAMALVQSADRLNEQLAADKKGGGGGPAESGTVRRLFRDTAYWNPAVVTGADGKAEVTVELPDNLTTWNLSVKGVTGADTLVGNATNEVLSTKDVLIRPVLPRFLVVGDTAQLEAVVNNSTAKRVDVKVDLKAIGLSVAGEPTQSLRVEPGGKGKVVWAVNVPAAGLNPPTAPGAFGEVTAQMGVGGDGYTDTVELALPVYQFTGPEVVATSGEAEARTVEQIKLPANTATGQGQLTLELNPSLAAASLKSLDWIKGYPYECVEQTVSKFLPNLATYQTIQTLKLDRPALKDKLGVEVGWAIQRLYFYQGSDGGWGWWSASGSNPWISAYALYGLQSAKQAGFGVDENVMTRGTQYLTDFLDTPVDAAKGWDLNQRAFIAFVLAGQPDFSASRAVVLYDRRAGLNTFGQTFLALALDRAGDDQAERVKVLTGDLAAAAKVSATGSFWEDEGDRAYREGMDTTVRSTALAVMALSRLAPESPELPGAVRWLMNERRDGRWETTQETAWTIQALGAYMDATGELKGDYTFDVELNAAKLQAGKVSAANIDASITVVKPVRDLKVDAVNELVLRRLGQGKLYYNTHLEIFQPAAELEPLARGIALGRQYFMVDPKTLKATKTVAESAKIGDLVQVKLTVIAPNHLSYVMLEDHLPAGFEAVDTTLNTTSMLAQGPQIESVRGEGETSSSDGDDWWSWPWWRYWVQSQLLDDRVALFSDELDTGTYEYTYLMRASLAGTFNVIPAHAEEMYFPEVFGRSAGGRFTVAP